MDRPGGPLADGKVDRTCGAGHDGDDGGLVSLPDDPEDFDVAWTEVLVTLDGGEETVISLSPSFWRTCPELRSAEVGRWLLAAGAAPWERGQPPHVVVTPIHDNRFSARILKPKRLPGAS